jgi:hypothetical protein
MYFNSLIQMLYPPLQIFYYYALWYQPEKQPYHGWKVGTSSSKYEAEWY